jgi:4-amino-4-deoxy-L-arabinose transferase-like glycosyltransferase
MPADHSKRTRRHGLGSEGLELMAAGLSAVMGAALALVWFWKLDAPFSYDYDEGVYLEAARLSLGNHALFRETFSSQPPLYPCLLRTAFSIFGETVAVGRAVSVVAALSTCLLLAKAAWDAIGPWAAPAALALCAGALSFFEQARVYRAEMVALAFGVAAVTAVSHPERAVRLRWQVAAGALMGAALAARLLMAPFILAMLAAVGWPARHRPGVQMLFPSIIALGSTFLVLLLICAPFGLREVYASSVGFRFRAHSGSLLRFHGASLRELFVNEGLLAPIALAGALALARQRSSILVLCGAWIVGCAGFLSWHAPLFAHHLVLIISPLAFTGAGVLSIRFTRPWTAPALLPLVCMMTLVKFEPVGKSRRPRFAPTMWARTIAPQDPHEAEQWQAVNMIRRLTTSAEVIVTDDQILAFRAGRDTPGELCDTSFVRISSKSLDAEAAIRAASGTKLIVLRTNRLNRLPQFVAWMRKHYLPLTCAGAVSPVRGFYLPRARKTSSAEASRQ